MGNPELTAKGKYQGDPHWHFTIKRSGLLCQLSRSQDRKATHGAGERDTRHPGSSGPLPPEGLASAGTSGLHRRWSLGGNSPQPGLAKTCDPNVDPWPRWLRLPSSGPCSIHQGAGRCLLPFHLSNRHLLNVYLLGIGPHTRHWGHIKGPHPQGSDSSGGNSPPCGSSGRSCVLEKAASRIKGLAL